MAGMATSKPTTVAINAPATPGAMAVQFFDAVVVEFERGSAIVVCALAGQFQRVACGAVSLEEFFGHLARAINLAGFGDNHRPAKHRYKREHADRDLSFSGRLF